MLPALMLQGTASHVGKSVLTAAFGRWLRERGLRALPFKAQNMSLNSYVTQTGDEIARSQAMQAEAMGVEPTADMNPILLKPLERGCQVIVRGQSVGVMSIQEYYAYKETAWKAIAAAYDRLARQADVVVLEGAGSPAEINLKANDLVNMRMAEHAQVAVILVADIERGGVFAQLIGTWELLEPAERKRIIGFVINKFRGDASLLQSGLAYIRERTGRPVLGVLPFDPAVQLDEEDSLGLDTKPGTAEVDVAVLRLPGLSNFTDFAALGRAPGVAVRYVSEPSDLHRPDVMIVPGTRTTIRALQWLGATGWADVLKQMAADPNGAFILGICGGCQLLGRTITDKDGVESDVPFAVGLGLLDLDTHFDARKTLHRIQGSVAIGLCEGCSVVGYEIHHGASFRRAGATAWLRLRREPDGDAIDEGAVNGRVCGTYVHGLFDDARFCQSLIATLRRRRRLPSLSEKDWLSRRENWARRYNRLGNWLREHCDLRAVAAALGIEEPRS